MTALTEQWRVIADFPAYAVSDLGRVKRIKVSARGHRVTGDCLKPVTAKGKAYQFVTLCLDGAMRQCRINRLVCEAFHGPPPTPEHQAAHNDGDPSNNRAGNLRWATCAENEADKTVHGTAAIGDRHWSRTKPESRARGQRHGLAKLTPDKVRKIRADNRPHREIAADAGVSKSTVGRVKAGHLWGHIA